MRFFKELVHFLKNVAGDEQIPARDKKVILALIALIISPIDLIPDWIPILGVLDDIVMLAIILDYFFEVLDQEILLKHWPWNMKKFVRLRQVSKLITHLTPSFVKKALWKFEGSPYLK